MDVLVDASLVVLTDHMQNRSNIALRFACYRSPTAVRLRFKLGFSALHTLLPLLLSD